MDDDSLDDDSVDDDSVDDEASADEDGSSPSVLAFASVSVAADAPVVSDVGATSAGEGGAVLALVVAEPLAVAVVTGAGGPAGAEFAVFCSVDVAGAGSVVEGSATRGAGASAVVSCGFTTVVGDAGATGVMTGGVVGATVCGSGAWVWV